MLNIRKHIFRLIWFDTYNTQNQLKEAFPSQKHDNEQPELLLWRCELIKYQRWMFRKCMLVRARIHSSHPSFANDDITTIKSGKNKPLIVSQMDEIRLALLLIEIHIRRAYRVKFYWKDTEQCCCYCYFSCLYYVCVYVRCVYLMKRGHLTSTTSTN